MYDKWKSNKKKNKGYQNSDDLAGSDRYRYSSNPLSYLDVLE